MTKQSSKAFDVFLPGNIKSNQFGAGDVEEILGIKAWRLQKFLTSPRYRLSPSGQLGRGQGSRRWFTDRDIYRIGIAVHLIRDGFAPKVVSAVLEDIEDQELIESDEAGRRVGFITFGRSIKGIKLGLHRSVRPPEIKPEGPIYYAFDLGQITQEIDDRIAKFMTKKGGR